jgi:hypothetical protein
MRVRLVSSWVFPWLCREGPTHASVGHAPMQICQSLYCGRREKGLHNDESFSNWSNWARFSAKGGIPPGMRWHSTPRDNPAVAPFGFLYFLSDCHLFDAGSLFKSRHSTQSCRVREAPRLTSDVQPERPPAAARCPLAERVSYCRKVRRWCSVGR